MRRSLLIGNDMPLHYVEWTGDDGALCWSHEMLEQDAAAMAATLEWAGVEDVEIIES